MGNEHIKGRKKCASFFNFLSTEEMNRVTYLFLMLSWTCVTAMAQHQLETYPAPEGAALNDDFDVAVRIPGGEWKHVDTYAFKVDEVVNYRHTERLTSVATFDFEGQVEVRVKSKTGPVATSRVRPLSYQIQTQTADSTLAFTLSQPRNISVEVNGDIYRNLQLFACPMDANKPKKKKMKNLIYFAPGIHQLQGDSLHIPSGTTVYLAGGAVLKGFLSTYGNDDIRICGRGIVDPGRHEGVMVRYSRNVEVDGIITTQMPVGGSENVRITNCKVISWYGWGDGFNVFASNKVYYDQVFARTSDDCSTIYCTRKGYHGGCKDIMVRNAVYWADVAHPIMIGLHGDIEKNEVIEHVVYDQVDILDQAEYQVDYQGCIGINNGDNILVRDVTFQHIRIENMRKGMLFNFRVCFNKKYCTAPGRGIENVTLRDISYQGEGERMSVMAGYNEERSIKNIRFENFLYNGKVISDDMPEKPKWYKTSDMANLFIGEHVGEVTFSR